MKKSIKYFIGLFCTVLLIAFVAYMLWLRQGRSLNTELIPTAEVLIHEPLPLPAFIYINPHAGANFDLICLSLLGSELLKKGRKFTESRKFIAFNTFLYINNRPISPVEISYPYGGSIGDEEGGTVYLCYKPELEKGIHIAEVTTKDTSGTEFYYKWAFTIQ